MSYNPFYANPAIAAYTQYPYSVPPAITQNQQYGSFATQSSPMQQQPINTPVTPVQAQPQQLQMQLPPKTNKIYVTGIEDATSRMAEPNSEMLYRHQDDQILYEVFTDLQGKKTVKAYRYEEITNEPKRETSAVSLDGFVTKDEFTAFQAKIVTKDDLAELESKLAQYVKQSTTSRSKKATETPLD